MCKKRVRGKGRKTKKQRKNLYRCGNGEKVLFSYSKKRKMDRKSHVSSIACARKAGENYWDMWDRGYPNRTRIRTYFTHLSI
jgi:hypothetical protein